MKLIKLSAFFASLISFFSITNTAQILCLIDVILEKHQMWDSVLFNALAAKGHSLTVVSAQWNKHLHDSINYIDMGTSVDINLLFDEEYSWMSTLLWYERVNEYCRGMLEPHVIKKIQNIHFDVILYDVTYGSFCTFHLVQLWENATIVGISASKITSESFEMVRGGTFNPACVPHPQSLYSGQEKMYFLSRLYNIFFYWLNYLSKSILKDAVITDMLLSNIKYQQMFITFNIQSLRERIKFILVNSNPAINFVQPLPPNVIEVGGLHIEEPKPLLEKSISFLNNTIKEVVYISLIDMKYHDTIIASIRLCPEYAFVWNMGCDECIYNRPENLHCAAELCQNDILAHKKVVLFITVAEDMDLQDAVYHGVPIIALTQFVHQRDNAQRAHQLNFGVAISLESMTCDQLAEAIKSISSKLIYSSGIKYRQLIFRHQQRKPLETAVWWIERILKQPLVFDHLTSKMAKNYNFSLLHSWDILILGLTFFGLSLTFAFVLYLLDVSPPKYALKRLLTDMGLISRRCSESKPAQQPLKQQVVELNQISEEQPQDEPIMQPHHFSQKQQQQQPQSRRQSRRRIR